MAKKKIPEDWYPVNWQAQAETLADVLDACAEDLDFILSGRADLKNEETRAFLRNKIRVGRAVLEVYEAKLLATLLNTATAMSFHGRRMDKKDQYRRGDTMLKRGQAFIKKLFKERDRLKKHVAAQEERRKKEEARLVKGKARLKKRAA